MSERIHGFAPQVGIEYIDEVAPDTLTLPLEPPSGLTGGRVRDRLDELYPDSEIERRLREFAAPRLADPAILAPTRFEALLRGALEALEQSGEGTDGAPHAELTSLLRDEMALRDHLSAMRSVLLRA